MAYTLAGQQAIAVTHTIALPLPARQRYALLAGAIGKAQPEFPQSSDIKSIK